MRANPLVAALAAAAILVGTAGAALAQGPPSDGAGSERQQAAQERRAALEAARASVLDAFRENRTLVVEEYRASLAAIRASYLENKTLVLEGCNATRAAFTNNSGGDGAPEHAKCVSDGLKPLIEKARGEMRAAREHAQERLLELRQHGLSEWAKARQGADARYQARAGETAPGA